MSDQKKYSFLNAHFRAACEALNTGNAFQDLLSQAFIKELAPQIELHFPEIISRLAEEANASMILATGTATALVLPRNIFAHAPDLLPPEGEAHVHLVQYATEKLRSMLEGDPEFTAPKPAADEYADRVLEYAWKLTTAKLKAQNEQEGKAFQKYSFSPSALHGVMEVEVQKPVSVKAMLDDVRAKHPPFPDTEPSQ